MKKNSRIKIVFIVLLILMVLPVSLLYYSMTPADDRGVTITVEIPIGAGFPQIVDILDDAGVVKNRPLFYALAILKNARKRFRAGEYEIDSSMTPAEIIDRLVRGIVKGYKVTIPEDLNLREVAARLVSQRLVDKEEFLKLATDKRFLASLNIKAPSVDGFLYPNTYNFTRSMGAKEIIKVMVNQFWKVYTPEMRRRAEALGMTTTQLITLASLIGKESGFKEEKPLIAAVFYNRLRKGMKLQSDPTAVYDLDNFSGSVKKSHLSRISPYNTYIIEGLPPGPIANPGVDSIKAALFPATVDYLYFVSNRNGSHLFSSTFGSHREAIQQYLKNN